MKKIFFAICMMASSSVFAASATLVLQDADGIKGSSDQRSIGIVIRESINNNFSVDGLLSNTWNESNGGVASFRIETGLTSSAKIIGPIGVYNRIAVGQKFISTGNFSYYSVEPGITAPIYNDLSLRIGYRFRNAFDDEKYTDETRTARYGLNYKIDKSNSLGVRYDVMRGDVNRNIIAVSYTRNF